MYPLTEAPKKINFVLNEELHSGKKKYFYSFNSQLGHWNKLSAFIKESK